MLAKASTFFAFLSVARATPYYPYPNGTNPTNITYLTGIAAPTPTFTPLPISCETFYPTDLRILNSRYPSFDMSPLHGRTQMLMLLRQLPTTFQIATQLQFSLPVSYRNSNDTCHLHLQLPLADTQTITGPQPIFNLFQVTREANVPATWDMYKAKDVSNGGPEPEVFGQVNGTSEARDKQWLEKGGVYDIGPTRCNETLTWQLGMAFDGGEEVNYWEFLNVQPPAYPSQGFRIVTGLAC
jgi:hypothetical protein